MKQSEVEPRCSIVARKDANQRQGKPLKVDMFLNVSQLWERLKISFSVYSSFGARAATAIQLQISAGAMCDGRMGASGFPAWNGATLGAEFQAGAGPERDPKSRERGLWETAAGRRFWANPAWARDRVPRFRSAAPPSTPSRTPPRSLRPRALRSVSPSQPSARPNGRSGASVSAKGLARISRSVREARPRRKERAGSGIRQCAKAPSRCGDLIGRACAGHVPVQGQALLHCAALRCDRRRCTRPVWAVAVISRNHPAPKGAPQ